MAETKQANVTELLQALADGKSDARSRLWHIVYPELRQIAAAKMAGEKKGHVLQATALVNDAYLKLVKHEDSRFETRQAFYAYAATVMERILVTWARYRRAKKRSGNFKRQPLYDQPESGDLSGPRRLLVDVADDADAADATPDLILTVHHLLERLQRLHGAEFADVVRLRFFLGMTAEDAATELGKSKATADRYWAFARAFLQAESKDLDLDEFDGGLGDER